MSEPVETEQQDASGAVPRRRSPLRRLGCGAALALWFLLLLTPCALFTMATQGQVVIPQGGLPGQEIRLWLITEIDQRGFGLSITSAHTAGDETCLQTNVRFLLWYGRADDHIVYCDCFVQQGDDWASTSSVPGSCTAEE